MPDKMPPEAQGLTCRWQSVTQNLTTLSTLSAYLFSSSLSEGPDTLNALESSMQAEDVQALYDEAMKALNGLRKMEGLDTDLYSLGYLKPGNDVTVCRFQVRPEAVPELNQRLDALNDALVALLTRLFTQMSRDDL